MSTIEQPHPMSEIVQDYRKRLMVFGGRASGELASNIARHLAVDLGDVTLKTFSNGEVYCRYEESIRGADVFIVQSTAANEIEGMTPNDALMELLAMIDAAQGASAHRIIAVMPWYGYARQDKKSAPREPISARIVAKCLEGVGVDRVLTMDLHAGQVQGFFHVPLDHMTAMPMLAQYVSDMGFDEELVIVSPDAGRVKTARNFARKIGTHWAVMEKERPAQQVAEIGYVVGEVKDKTAVLVDDMIDTAGTLTAAAQTVLDEGAKRVLAVATHGVFSGPAYERLAQENSGIERIVVTDTMPQRPGAPDNITVISAAQTLADSMRRIFTDDSVSEIFAGENQLLLSGRLWPRPYGEAVFSAAWAAQARDLPLATLAGELQLDRRDRVRDIAADSGLDRGGGLVAVLDDANHRQVRGGPRGLLLDESHAVRRTQLLNQLLAVELADLRRVAGVAGADVSVGDLPGGLRAAASAPAAARDQGRDQRSGDPGASHRSRVNHPDQTSSVRRHASQAQGREKRQKGRPREGARAVP